MKRMNELSVGECATVASVDVRTSMKRRFLDLGLVPDSKVECVGKSPGGDPSAYLIRGAVIAIRSQDCSEIFVR